MAENKKSFEFNLREHGPLLAVVGVGLVLVYLVFWQTGKAWNGWGEIGELNEKIEEIDTKLEKLEALAGGEFQEYSEKAEEVLPKNKPVFESFDSLVYLAKLNQIELTSLSTSPGAVSTGSAVVSRKSGDNYEAVLITLEVEGEHEGLMGFILGVDKASPLIEVSEVRLRPRNVEGQERVSAEIDVNYYWMPEPEVNLGKNIKAYELSQADKDIMNEVEDYQSFVGLELEE